MGVLLGVFLVVGVPTALLGLLAYALLRRPGPTRAELKAAEKVIADMREATSKWPRSGLDVIGQAMYDEVLSIADKYQKGSNV